MGEKGVLLVKKWFDRLTIPSKVEGMHKKNKKMTKNDQKELFLVIQIRFDGWGLK